MNAFKHIWLSITKKKNTNHIWLGFKYFPIIKFFYLNQNMLVVFVLWVDVSVCIITYDWIYTYTHNQCYICFNFFIFFYSELVFEAPNVCGGVLAFRYMFQSLAPGTCIDAAVIDCWSALLNYEESKRKRSSISRVFLYTSVLVSFNFFKFFFITNSLMNSLPRRKLKVGKILTRYLRIICERFLLIVLML